MRFKTGPRAHPTPVSSVTLRLLDCRPWQENNRPRTRWYSRKVQLRSNSVSFAPGVAAESVARETEQKAQRMGSSGSHMNKRHSFIYRRNPGKILECMTDQSTCIFKFREIFHFVSVENVTLVEPKKLFFLNLKQS